MSRLIESLESRRLLHADISVSVNFQPLNAPRAPGLLTDYGAIYGVRRGGISYGWSSDQQANSVDRNLTKIQKNDTYIAFSGNTHWDLAVENGTYDVYIVAGDPGAANERMAITAEGDVAVTGITRKAKRYIEGLAHVNVTDGKLTIGNAAWAPSSKICYLAVVTTEGVESNTITLDAPDNSATEGGQRGLFRISRNGPGTDRPLTVPLTIGGSATNGVDYGVFGKSVTFAAGVTSIDLPVRAAADGIVEGNETVTLSLTPPSGYAAGDTSATVTIADADNNTPTPPLPTNVSWSAKAARPVAASEVLGATVNGKLYSFGGFVDTTYHPTKSAYSYNVSSNTWTRLADLPVGLTHAGVATDETRYIYIGGGYPGNGTGGQQTFSSKTVYRYDTQSDTYSTLPDLPAARGAGSMALLGNVLYFFAGENSSRQDVTSTYALDLTNTGAGWATKASIPSAKNHVAAVPLNGKIYLIGGQTGNDQGTVTQGVTYRYNPTTDNWTTLASIPTARSHISDASFVYGDKIVVLGGQSGYNAPIASCVIYDPDSNTWSTLNSLPDARYSGVGAYIGGKFVYTAGIKSNFSSTTWVGTLS